MASVSFQKSHFLTSGRFDIGLTAIAAASFIFPHPQWAHLVVQGARGFALTNLADRSLRKLFLDKFNKKDAPILNGISFALIEEALYSGLLLTRYSESWISQLLLGTARFGASFILGSTAARTFEPIEKQPVKGISRDFQRGFIWAIFRESVFSALPVSISNPLLIAADSIVFGLAEVCPTKDSPSLTKYSYPWLYKSLSGGALRAIANLFAIHIGWTAALTQHFLFNLSRSFPEK